MTFRPPFVASLAAVSALGGAAAASVALPSAPAPARPVAALPAATPGVEIRTRTIHRTVHVVRHVHHKPPRPSVAAAAPVPTLVPAAPAPAATVTAPVPTRPLRSATSSGHGRGGDDGEHETEHEGGDD